jgi:cyanophycin synthetase
VIKPIDGNHGKGNTTNITNWEQAPTAFEAAKVFQPQCDCENALSPALISGCLVINYKFICAALRTPASVNR